MCLLLELLAEPLVGDDTRVECRQKRLQTALWKGSLVLKEPPVEVLLTRKERRGPRCVALIEGFKPIVEVVLGELAPGVGAGQQQREQHPRRGHRQACGKTRRRD